jgi:DNA-binding ferritin-like protein
MVEEKMRDQIDKIVERQQPILRNVVDAIEEANDTKKTKSIVQSLMKDLDEAGVDKLTKIINDRIQEGKSVSLAFLKTEYKNLLVSQNINDTVKSQIKDLVEKTKLYDEAQAALKSAIKQYNDAKDQATASGTPLTAKEVSNFQKQMVAAFVAANAAQQQAAQANNTLAVYYSDPKNAYKTFATLMQLKLLTAQSFIVNVLGNVVTVPFRLMSVAGASMLDFVLSKSAQIITGKEQQRRVMLMPQLSSVINGRNKVIMNALGDIIAKGTTPETISTLDSKHSLNWNRAAKELTGKIATAMQHKDFESRLSTFFEATFGITADVAARLLAVGDVPFRKMAEFGKLQEIGERKGLKGADLTAFVLDPDEDSAKIAKDFGLKVTYQDENIAADFIQSAGSYIDRFANDRGAFGYHVSGIMHILKTAVVPFVKTPLNLLWDTLGYVSPHYAVAQAMVSLANANKARKNGETSKMQEHIGEFEKNISKAGIAMAISIMVKALAEAGGLTGDDEDEKVKAMSYSGEAPPQRSLNLSMFMDMMMGKFNPEKERDPSLDVWINYDKLGVVGMAIGTQALLYSDKTKQEIKDMSVLVEMTKVVGMPAMKTVMSQSFMKGAFEVMKVVMDGNSEKSFNRYMQATTTAVSSALYSNTLATLSKATDKYLANTTATNELGESLKLTFKSRLFMGDELPSRVNVWGDKQAASPAGTNKYAWYFLNATKAKTVDASNSTYKVWEVYQRTLDKDVLPSPPAKNITVKNEKVELSPEEYERYQIYVGKTRRALAESYILRGGFENHSDENKAKVLKSSYSKGQEFGKTMFILSTPRLYEMYGYSPKAAKAELDVMQNQVEQLQKK